MWVSTKETRTIGYCSKILKYSQKNPFKNDRPCQPWYNSFLKRNPEHTLLSAESINKARAGVIEESITIDYGFESLKTF